MVEATAVDAAADDAAVAHEAGDLPAGLLAWLAGGLTLFVVLVAVSARLMFPAVADDRDRGPRAVPAGIPLQTDARGDLLADRARHAGEVAAIDRTMRRLTDDAKP